MSVIVPDYASPSLSNAGFAQQESSLWVRGAFGTPARQAGGNAYNIALGISAPLAALNTQLWGVKIAERLASCTGTEIDSWAADYFGGNLPRNSGELDSAYIARIQANLAAKKGTAAGIITIGNVYGTTSLIEPWAVAFTGCLDSPTLAFDSTEGCLGSQVPDVSVFISVASSMSTATQQQANLSVLGAKPAGLQLNTYQVVGTTATLLA